MGSFALAHYFTGNDRRVAARRKRLRTIALPWTDVPVARLVSPKGERRHWILASALAVCVLAVHASFVWYVDRHRATNPVPSRKHEVAVEIVTPPLPPPPPPQVEPPKPPPPRMVKRQVLPPIQTATPDTPEVDTTPGETPVSVAPSAPEPASPPPPAPEPITAPFGRAGYLNNPPPAYPPAAARQGWQGTVLLKVRVLSNGRVDSVEVQKSSGHKLLDEEATATVRSWQFTPSKRGDTPIDGWATVPIEFKLDI